MARLPKTTTTTIFVALNKNGFVKATKNRASLARDEIGVALKLNVPTSAFRSPTIEATITVPDHAVVVPEIRAEVIDGEAQ